MCHDFVLPIEKSTKIYSGWCLDCVTAVDRPFVKYLRALARFQEGDQSKTTLNLMREAYRDAQTAPLTPQERAQAYAGLPEELIQLISSAPHRPAGDH